MAALLLKLLKKAPSTITYYCSPTAFRGIRRKIPLLLWGFPTWFYCTIIVEQNRYRCISFIKSGTPASPSIVWVIGFSIRSPSTWPWPAPSCPQRKRFGLWSWRKQGNVPPCGKYHQETAAGEGQKQGSRGGEGEHILFKQSLANYINTRRMEAVQQRGSRGLLLSIVE